MALEHDNVPRFTPEQRDKILNLASRLQAQHETTVSADELVRVAEEAGIDPRFVQEAAMRLGRKAQPISRTPIFALCFFAFQALMFIQNPLLYGSRPNAVIVSALVSFALALWAAREKRIRPFVPIASTVVWIVTGLAVSGYAILRTHEAPIYILPFAVSFGFIQTIAAICGTLISTKLDRAEMKPRTARTINY